MVGGAGSSEPSQVRHPEQQEAGEKGLCRVWGSGGGGGGSPQEARGGAGEGQRLAQNLGPRLENKRESEGHFPGPMYQIPGLHSPV